MKRIFMASLALAFIFFAACKSGKEKKDTPTEKTEAEKLMEEIDDLHMQGMSKMAKLTGLRQQATKVIDSVVAGSKKLVTSSKKELDNAIQKLTAAEATMEEWMVSFYRNMDTLAENNIERVKYLSAEKLKAANLRDAILNSIHKADSLLKTKLQ